MSDTLLRRTAEKKIRVALIGCGKMGLQHLRAIRRIPSAVVVGIADPAADGAAVRAAAGDHVGLFQDAASLFSATSPNVVHIVTPPATHAKLALQALEAGCHVYVEKPFTTTLAEARTVLRVAAERGLNVCAGHQCLFESPALHTRDLLSSVGRVVHVTSHFSFRQVRRNLSPVEQCKDILPHAVYPLLQQLRIGAHNPAGAIEILGCDARPSGDLFALLRFGDASGFIRVSLTARPVEQYQEIAATNGALRTDYVTGKVIRLPGPGTGPGALFVPYRRAWQSLRAANHLLFGVLRGRSTSYSGLHELVRRFYDCVALPSPPPIAPDEILETVCVCERLGAALDAAEEAAASEALQRLEREAAALPPVDETNVVLVTGGTGFLGRQVAAELRHAGFRTRVVARRLPPFSRRVADVEYCVADLSADLDPAIFGQVGTVVHCAAETAGGSAEHARNSIGATRNLVEAAARAGIRRIVHLSSLAVLKPSFRRSRPLDEQSPIGGDHATRGPYVWGKAESEMLARRMAADAGIELRIIRPGPLVDHAAFEPPGRLGRELGPIFVAIGPRRSPLPVCDIRTVARVIRSYVQNFAAAPALVNLTEGTPPTRIELLRRHLESRKDLRAWWISPIVLRLVNGPARLAQRLLLKSSQPVDLYSAFASAHYRTDLAAEVIARAGPSSVPGV